MSRVRRLIPRRRLCNRTGAMSRQRRVRQRRFSVKHDPESGCRFSEKIMLKEQAKAKIPNQVKIISL
jgi:hypothetical protein